MVRVAAMPLCSPSTVQLISLLPCNLITLTMSPSLGPRPPGGIDPRVPWPCPETLPRSHGSTLRKELRNINWTKPLLQNVDKRWSQCRGDAPCGATGIRLESHHQGKLTINLRAHGKHWQSLECRLLLVSKSQPQTTRWDRPQSSLALSLDTATEPRLAPE